ncbi:MAG: hypothetical protein KDC24_11675 [Saprospiraceae bacterium]|nr:hypothetical protein [Saprospiraceae bacterium]
MKYLFLSLLVLHGLIHLMGFAKGFQLADIKELTLPVSKMAGLFWFAAFAMFGITAAMYGMDKPLWWIPAFAAITLSQLLIIGAWQDAKYGTIANAMILLVAMSAFFAFQFEQQYKNDVLAAQNEIVTTNSTIITEDVLAELPDEVTDYLKFTNWDGKIVPVGFKAVMHGRMRNKTLDWFDFTTEQYNFFDKPTRLFFMKAKMFGLPVLGYHKYADGQSSMDIRLLGLIPVAQHSGKDMLHTETVSFFNDIVLFAPGRLVAEGIEYCNESNLECQFSAWNENIKAELFFRPDGSLYDFTSKDRMDVDYGDYLPWSTPIPGYKLQDELRIPTHGDVIFEYPDGPFTYGEFDIDAISYFFPKA